MKSNPIKTLQHSKRPMENWMLQVPITPTQAYGKIILSLDQALVSRWVLRENYWSPMSCNFILKTLETSNWSQKKYYGDSIAPRGSLRTNDNAEIVRKWYSYASYTYQLVQTTFLYTDLVQIVP